MRNARYVMSLLAALALLGAPAVAKDFDHDKICDAIRNRLELRVFYRPGESERVVIPRFLGYTSARKVILTGLQISGFSESGNLPGHRSFRLDRTSEIEFTATVVPNPIGSGRPPNGMVEVICARN